MSDDWKQDLKDIKSKVDSMDGRLHKQEKHLAVYNEQLTIHIQGTAEANRKNDLTEQKLELEIAKVNKTLNPIQTHVKVVNFCFRYVLLPIAIAAIVFWVKANL